MDAHIDGLEQWLEQANHWVNQKNHHNALLYFNKAVLWDSTCAKALMGCAKTLMDLNRPAEAAVYSERALQHHFTSDILTVHAQVLYRLGSYVEALNCFERIAADDPNNYIALNQRALCLTQINRYEEAQHVYQQALHLSNGRDPLVHYNYSLCLLTMGKLTLGFKAFEARWLGPLLAKRCAWVIPEHASTKTLHGKSILVRSEQGLGDSILFFRYIPLLLALGARIYLEIQPTLIPLFQAWRCTITFFAQGSSLPNCDYHCSMMSLARLFKTEVDTIPMTIPYLSPCKKIYESCLKKLGHATNYRVGIAWRGSALNAMNSQRSMALQTLLTVHQPHFDFICLQQDVSFEEKKVLEQFNIPYHSLELSTLAGTAALIACLDLVLTIDTSIAHLAATMGKTVWILLPFSADWRWFLDREDSLWYPENVTLFRQNTLGDWSYSLSRVQNALITFKPFMLKITAYDCMQQANQQLQQGLFFEAEQLYRNMLKQEPINHQALHGIALCTFQQNKIAESIVFMHQAIEIAPDNTLYKRHLGEILRRIGQVDVAIALLQSAVELEPQLAENHYLLGVAHHTHRQLELAMHHYRIALSYDPTHGLAWNNLGSVLEGQGNKAEAKAAYVQAIHLNHQHAEAQNNLGAIYSEEGLLQEARLHFETAITANPHFIDAHYNLSLIKTYTANDPHLTFLESMLSKINDCDDSTRIHYYFALGKALDDLQHYERAFEAYAEGNRLYYQYHPWDKAPLQKLIEDIPTVFTSSFLTSGKKTNETRCPIFIVGMPRAGTTLIEQTLASHEYVYGAGELSILDDVIQRAQQKTNQSLYTWVTQLSDEDFLSLGEQYLDRTWRLAPDKQYIIDKMPANFFYIGLIYRMLPTAKIVHAIRDPMDSCFSCFTHLFKEAMVFAYDLTSLGHYYILYAQAMQHWHATLPAGGMFDLVYEDMVNDHERVSKELISYLGLSWDPNCLHFYNNQRVVKTASLTQVRKPIYKTSLRRWEHFAKMLDPLLQIVTPYRHLKGISA